MLFVYNALASDNINKKLIPLISASMQDNMLIKHQSEISDKVLQSYGDKLKKRMIMDDEIMRIDPVNANVIGDMFAMDNAIIESFQLEQALDMDISTNSILKYDEDKEELYLEASNLPISKLGAPTWASIERRDADGVTRTLIFGTFMRVNIIQNTVFTKILKEARPVMGNKLIAWWRSLLSKFTLFRKLYTFYEYLKYILKKQSKSSYTVKEILVDDKEAFIYLHELDLLSVFGESMSTKEVQKFIKRMKWGNVVVDLQSENLIAFFGKDISKKQYVSLIPYKSLVKNYIDSRETVEDYFEVQKSEKSLFGKYNVTLNKVTKVINKSLKR